MRAKSALIVVFLCAMNLPALSDECVDKITGDSKYTDVIACLRGQMKTIDNLQKQVAELYSLRTNLLSWSGDAPAVGAQQGSGDPRTATMCPEGTYAAGINWWGAPSATRYCVGCVSGIQVICRKLNAK